MADQIQPIIEIELPYEDAVKSANEQQVKRNHFLGILAVGAFEDLPKIEQVAYEKTSRDYLTEHGKFLTPEYPNTELIVVKPEDDKNEENTEEPDA